MPRRVKLRQMEKEHCEDFSVLGHSVTPIMYGPVNPKRCRSHSHVVYWPFVVSNLTAKGQELATDLKDKIDKCLNVASINRGNVHTVFRVGLRFRYGIGWFHNGQLYRKHANWAISLERDLPLRPGETIPDNIDLVDNSKACQETYCLYKPGAADPATHYCQFFVDECNLPVFSLCKQNSEDWPGYSKYGIMEGEMKLVHLNSWDKFLYAQIVAFFFLVIAAFLLRFVLNRRVNELKAIDNLNLRDIEESVMRRKRQYDRRNKDLVKRNVKQSQDSDESFFSG